MSRQMKLLFCCIALMLTMIAPTLAQDAGGGRAMTDQEMAIAAAVAECPMDESITLAASVPGLNFPFFVHMMNQLVA
ncbi:MAG: hypothetical protein H7175_10240, partial [Burkholderiales bacterium]|nr:hypothetical protein [Anaerolineae bacterium]